jgi:hypothetical protein
METAYLCTNEGVAVSIKMSEHFRPVHRKTLLRIVRSDDNAHVRHEAIQQLEDWFMRSQSPKNEFFQAPSSFRFFLICLEGQRHI